MFTVGKTMKKTNSKAVWTVTDTCRDVVAFCPRCKAMESLTLCADGIVPTRRFIEKAGAVYHACGSDVPCRLYSLS